MTDQSAEPFDFDGELRAALGDAYVIERELTGSGMSRVFVATERALDRKVVIKVLPPELAAGVNRERFRREIQLAAQLQHPHIVPLHTAGIRGDLLYFTMPFIEGESLRHAVHEGVRFSPREVVRILHDVSDALAYAHARGIIHRDIKPGNVLRSGTHAMVTDFGVAKAISVALPRAGVTTSGVAIGTPAYMAPEQLASDPSADHRVDIYALGLLGYELLSGEAPFKAPSPQETMAAQLTRVPEPITRKRPDVPPALATLLSRCLAKNPADRPQTAAEVTRLLDEIDVTSSAVPARPGRPTSRVAMGVAAVALAVVAGVLVWSRANSRPAEFASTTQTGGATPPAAPVLTREDSLAIAEAIQKKLAEEEPAVQAKRDSGRPPPPPAGPPPPPPRPPLPVPPSTPAATAQPAGTPEPAAAFAAQMAQMAESLRVEIQKAVLDSVARQRGRPALSAELERVFGVTDSAARAFRRWGGSDDRERGDRRSSPTANVITPEAFALRLENLGPPRRLFVAYPQVGRDEQALIPTVDSLLDTLRRALGASPRYVLIDADSVRQMLEQTRNVNTVAEQMKVDLFASVSMNVTSDGSVLWHITTRDLTAHPAFSTRSAMSHAPRDTPLAPVGTLVRTTVRMLEEMDRAPRRAPASAARGRG